MSTSELFGNDAFTNACERCDESVNGGLIAYGNAALCQDCANDSFICHRCNETMAACNYGATNRDDDIICDSCAVDYLHCDACDVDVLKTNYHYSADVCNMCHADNYSDCDYCGCAVENDYAYYSERSGNTYCEDCYYENDENPGVRGYHEGAPWGLKFHNGTADNSAMYFGVEIEMGGYGDVSDILSHAEALQIGHAESDSSVEGLEYITQPATLSAWREEFGAQTGKVVNALAGAGYTGDADDCGGHIHISRAAFDSDYHLAKFVTAFVLNPEFMGQIAGRDTDQWGSLGKYSRGELRRAVKWQSGDRYRAVNLNNHNTVEIRMFSGTHDKSYIISRIAFLSALVEYTRALTASDLAMGALHEPNIVAAIMSDEAHIEAHEIVRWTEAGSEWVAA